MRKADGAFIELDSETHSPTPTFIHHCWNLCNLVKFFGFLWENAAAPPVIHCCDNCSPDKLPRSSKKSCFVQAQCRFRDGKKPGQIVLQVTFVIVQPEEEYWSLLSNRGGGNKNRFSTRPVSTTVHLRLYLELDSCTGRYVWSDSALPQAWRGGGALTTKPKIQKL